MKFSEYYDAVSKQDFPGDVPHGWIQWKGTEVCIDLYCVCGHHGHVDAEFFYNYECPECRAKYALGANVKLIPLTAEQVEFVEREYGGFVAQDGE